MTLLFVFLLYTQTGQIGQAPIPVFQMPPPNTFNCGVDNNNSSTLCQSAPGAGLSLYITDVMISNGPTAQAIRIRAGTGGSCSSPTLMIPRVFFPINDKFNHSYRVPIKAPVNAGICCDISGSTAFSCSIQGYIAP